MRNWRRPPLLHSLLLPLPLMDNLTTVLEHSRKEARFVAVLWVLACVYTVGYCALFGYRVDTPPRLVLGMPTWVFWGIVVPWVVCTLITCWYSLRGVCDEDLGEDRAEASHG